MSYVKSDSKALKKIMYPTDKNTKYNDCNSLQKHV